MPPSFGMAFWMTPPTCASAGAPPASKVSSAVAASFISQPICHWPSSTVLFARIPSFMVWASFHVDPCTAGQYWPSPIPVFRTPGISRARALNVRAAGSTSIICRVATNWRRTCCTSTTGDSPETVTVSSSAPTAIWAFTCRAALPIRSSPSRTKVLNPGSVKVTAYSPGRRLTMVKRPDPSVNAVIVPSMLTGLSASTVTPGRIPPVVSSTRPEIEPCAPTVAGSRSPPTPAIAIQTTSRRILCPLLDAADRPAPHPSHRPEDRRETRHSNANGMPDARFLQNVA